jgi:hypothetical protein
VAAAAAPLLRVLRPTRLISPLDVTVQAMAVPKHSPDGSKMHTNTYSKDSKKLEPLGAGFVGLGGVGGSETPFDFLNNAVRNFLVWHPLAIPIKSYHSMGPGTVAGLRAGNRDRGGD